ncbi:MAG: hypothetical protein E3J66_01555 [Dehalococcoidia bacterium]|nr:MAG: hypothetical protein E3J66_01555 [Dehalococcoidia bacterium]
MKALSMKQPWAWLVCVGIKDTENRYWHLRAGLPRRIYVHTSKTIDREAFAWLVGHIPKDILAKAMVNGVPNAGMFITGAIIGEVDLVSCKFRGEGLNANLFSIWHMLGQWGFKLANPVLYDKPIPCKGKLSFFEPDIHSG